MPMVHVDVGIDLNDHSHLPWRGVAEFYGFLSSSQLYAVGVRTEEQQWSSTLVLLRIPS